MKTYTDLLDGVRRGFPSQEALELLAQRVLDKPVIEKLKDAGKAPICLFARSQHTIAGHFTCRVCCTVVLLLLQSGTSVPRSVKSR